MHSDYPIWAMKRPAQLVGLSRLSGRHIDENSVTDWPGRHPRLSVMLPLLLLLGFPDVLWCFCPCFFFFFFVYNTFCDTQVCNGYISSWKTNQVCTQTKKNVYMELNKTNTTTVQIHKLLHCNVTFEGPESLHGNLFFIKRIPCSYWARYKGMEIIICPSKWTL